MNAVSGSKEYAVLFVCMGNICRSPTAEGVLRTLHAQLAPELKLRIDSAGTHAYYHLGEQPDRRSQQAALRRGYDISEHRARVVVAEDFKHFDYVLAMDTDNLQHLRKLQPAASRAALGLLLDHAPAVTSGSVPDPYDGGLAGFDRVLDLVEQGALGLLRNLCDKQQIRFPELPIGQRQARH